MRDLPRRLTAALLLTLFAFCVYRAATQNLVMDEAWVFQRFVNQPLAEMAKSWDACNHVLHTLLMKWFRTRYGTAEIVLRIPTLIGAALYLSAVYWLTGLLFSGWRQPVAAGLLALHPFVVDFMVAARGYGLALGLFTWALYCAVSWQVRGRELRWLRTAGVLAGLSVAANLTLAVPVAALGLALLLMEFLSSLHSHGSHSSTVIGRAATGAAKLLSAQSRLPAAHLAAASAPSGGQTVPTPSGGDEALPRGTRAAAKHGFRAIEAGWRIVDAYFGPALVIATLIVIVPLLNAQPADFYFGEATALDSLRRMYDTTFKSEHGLFTATGRQLAPFAGPALALLFLCISGFTAVRVARREFQHYVKAPFALIGATLAICGLLLCILGTFGVKYPSGRTGLYLIPLFTLSVILLLPKRRYMGLLGTVVILTYVSQNDPRFFFEWRYDAGTRDLLHRMDEDQKRRNLPQPVSIGVSSMLSFTAAYYQLRTGAPWKIEQVDSSTVQYLLVDLHHKKDAESTAFEPIATDPLSGALLARRRP